MGHSKESAQINKYLIGLLVLLSVPITGLCIDIYVPSLPAISHYFNADKSLVQLSVTAYMVGLGFTQLFAGGVTDSFGRKKPFLVAMTIFILATLWVPYASTIHVLLFLRLLQGISVAMVIVPLRSIIPDVFKGAEFHKMASYMAAAWSVGPIVAPAIGGYLQYYVGWQSNFYFLAVYAIVMLLLVWLYVPETSVHRYPFQVSAIVGRYQQLLSHWGYVSGLLISGMVYSMIILFSIVAPFLMQTVLHYSAIQFGQMALLVGLAWFLGTLTHRMTLHIVREVKVKAALLSMLAIALVMVLLATHFRMTAATVLVSMLFMAWLGGTVLPGYFAYAMTLFSEMTGSANALFGSSLFLIPGLNSMLGTLLKSSTALPLALVFVGLIVVSLVVFFVERTFHYAYTSDLLLTVEGK